MNKKLEDKAYDPARDGGFSQSSSSEEDSDETDSEDGADEEYVGLALPGQEADQADAPMGEVTRRLAIVNMDWDNIRAVDLMAVFSSFASSEGGLGGIEKVAIFPSQFGKERMQREDMEGPPKELFSRKKKGHDTVADLEDAKEDSEEEEERIRNSLIKEDKGEEYSTPQLRRYQLERLRYYYAVVTCTTPALAQDIYKKVDGTEYLSSANLFDLRFIPDEMTFEDDKPRDECDQIPSKYRPNEFVTDALQHSKVKLTWDADDNKRKEVQKRAFTGSRKEISENDLQAYLGSGSSDEDDDQEGGVEVVNATAAMTVAEEYNNTKPNPSSQPETLPPKLSKREAERQRLRSLLGLGDEPTPRRSKGEREPVGDMQITFTSGLSDPKANGNGSMFDNEPVTEETTREKYIRKEKERKAKRREKAKAIRDGHSDQEDSQDDGDSEEEPKEDLGFDDPFFTDGLSRAKDKDKLKKKRSKEDGRRQQSLEQEAAEKQKAAERKELEELMGGNPGEGAGNDQHFSLATLHKAEKALTKNGKKKAKLSASQKAALEAKGQDRFQMDVSDPRFTAVFESSEFAIDPTHPGFKKTEGMNKLLEEGRRRRRNVVEDGEEVQEEDVKVNGKGKKKGKWKR